jgi:hypothetical protein
MDTMLSGTVPIFTHTQQYAVQPSWINWTTLSYLIDLDKIVTQKPFLEAINRILVDDGLLEQKHQAVLENRQLFDWTTLFPFDTYMYMLQAHMYPETRHATSRWSALILPPLPLSGNDS